MSNKDYKGYFEDVFASVLSEETKEMVLKELEELEKQRCLSRWELIFKEGYFGRDN